MSFLSDPEISRLLSTYGYGAVAGVIGLESMGIPLPGETTLIAAALVAGTTHALDIWLLVAAAAGAAILGDNIGFWIGRVFGCRLLLRYGRYLRLDERRILLGRYLFLRYGGAIVFVGRFVALLRALAAFLAGANRMPWPSFLLFNAAGGVAWAALYAMGAYYVGEEVKHLAAPVGIALGVLAVIAVLAAAILLRRHEAELEENAELALCSKQSRR
jgi:membrane protein DedA with SNARE-associated domain